ncbi:hypothetical protein DM01DRAFT_1038545 [Hesseltinella vesiculosa]|uniref:F-box domain-containing protein n=1 Tax=Hesseltinella vesiculosa TaxID=101127 RepID=A0A1X2GIS1_9FUNG|nr:hypothetical protein DM01DRAFT_1038545 [Hesseltinella vesiculosa]
MGSGPSPKSVASIQLSSPSPSPLATPQQTTGCATSTMDNTYYPPPLVFHPPRNNPHGHLHMHSVYPLVDIPTPPELKRISNTSDNCITVLEETCPNQVNQLRANVHPPASSITLARMSLCIEPSPLPEQVQQQQLPVLSSSSCVPTPAPRTSTPSDSAFDDFSMSSDPAPAVDSPNSALPSPVSDVDDWASQQQQQDEPLLPPPALAIPLDPRSLHVSTPHPLPITPTTATHSSDRMVVDTIDTKKKTTDGMLTLLDTYDALPSNIQDYMMLQLLRRTPMSSLRFASDMIMQVLKTDFISKLPRRLAQQILLYLDVRSLCRATAVSRYWRQVIDQDSWLWRVKICEADFAISPHELLDYPAYLPPQLQPQQHPASFSSRQLSQHLHSLQQQQPPATPNTASSEVPSSSSSVCSEIRSPLLSSMDEMVQDGVMTEPFNLLQSASDVGPSYYDPQHPFKHIYKRHYLIQYNWRHNRAQRTQVQGHGEVVTCLQFDDDKIITGFDDNCINIYDIKTGQLRRKLLGHEGGVWALQYVGNTLVTGSTDRTLRIWDIERGICRYVFCGHSSTVRCLHIVMPTPVTLPSGEVVIQPDQPKIISGSRDHTLRVWHLPYLPAKGYAPPSSTSSASSAAFPSHSSLPHHRRSSSAHSISVKPSASAAQPLSSSYPHHTSSHHHHHATTSVSDDPQLMDDYQAATSSATTTPSSRHITQRFRKNTTTTLSLYICSVVTQNPCARSPPMVIYSPAVAMTTPSVCGIWKPATVSTASRVILKRSILSSSIPKTTIALVAAWIPPSVSGALKPAVVYTFCVATQVLWVYLD